MDKEPFEASDSGEPRYHLRNRTAVLSSSSSHVLIAAHANLPAIDGCMAERRSREQATEARLVDPSRGKCRRFRGCVALASNYGRFVRNLANIAEPLTRMTKKNTLFEWTDEADEAFREIKTALMEVPILTFPHQNVFRILDTDASDVALGAVLLLVSEGVERPIAFYSRVMKPLQPNYCTTRELLAVIAALHQFRHYLLGNQVILGTDHQSLKWLGRKGY